MDPKMMLGEEMPPAEALPPEAPQMASREVCVPLASLAMPDEGEQMENPAPGDIVEFTTTGKVSRVEGDKAYVTMETVNGKPIEDKAAEAPADELAGLQQMAGELDQLG